MAEGLKPHRHVTFMEKVVRYYDHEKGCCIRKVIYGCMVPGCTYRHYELYECYYPPPKYKTKSLEKNKRKYNNHR